MKTGIRKIPNHESYTNKTEANYHIPITMQPRGIYISTGGICNTWPRMILNNYNYIFLSYRISHFENCTLIAFDT